MALNLTPYLGIIVFKEVPGAPQQLQFLSAYHWLGDLILLLLLFLLLIRLRSKYREVNQYLWEAEPSGEAKSSWTPLLLDSMLAVAVLLLIPQLLGLSWKEIAEWQPLGSYLLLLMLLLGFFSGIFLAYVRFAHRQKLKIKEKATAE